jgi:hypothetical protein
VMIPVTVAVMIPVTVAVMIPVTVAVVIPVTVAVVIPVTVAVVIPVTVTVVMYANATWADLQLNLGQRDQLARAGESRNCCQTEAGQNCKSSWFHKVLPS